jgi:tungstate transport system ATP-binding protein
MPCTGNRLTGRVEKVTPLGPYRKVHLNCGFPLVAYVPNHSPSAFSLKEGSEALASFAAEAVHVIPKKSPAA